MLNVIDFNTVLVLMAIVFTGKYLCSTLGTRIVRQPNESAAAEPRAEYCSAVLEIRLVSAQKPSLPLSTWIITHVFFCIDRLLVQIMIIEKSFLGERNG